MFFNELKVLVFMRSDSRQSGSDSDRRSSAMRGLGMGGCGWPPFVDCHPRDDEEEYYGSEPRPRSLAFEDKEPRLQVGLDAVSLASSSSSMRTPQCRICFQGPEQVSEERLFCHFEFWFFQQITVELDVLHPPLTPPPLKNIQAKAKGCGLIRLLLKAHCVDSLLNAAQWARITVCFARLIGQGGGGGGGPLASIATKKLGLQDDTWPCMSHRRKCVGSDMRVSVEIRVRVSGGIMERPSSAGAQLALTAPPKVHVCQISGDSWSRWLRAAFRPSRETKPKDNPPPPPPS